MEQLKKTYDKLILSKPIWTLLVVFAVASFFVYQAQNFKLDASADALLLEDDPDLRYYQRTMRNYSSDDFLIITWTPKQDMFSQPELDRLASLVTKLEAMTTVKTVNSILSVPLFHSPPVSLGDLRQGKYETLSSNTVDVAAARVELIESPMFRNMLINEDGNVCALQVTFMTDPDYQALVHRRQDLIAIKYEQGLSPEEKVELAGIQTDYREHSVIVARNWNEDVARVRSIMAEYDGQVTLFLGGVPMITADMVRYVENDLVVFGIGVLAFLLAALSLIFRRLSQVLLPLLTCLVVGLIMVGFLGLVDWRVTVISSNFVSLLFIITMSMVIHLVVRYRELQLDNPEADQHALVRRAAVLVAVPCLYCALTTMVGFGSLIVSGIQPVKDFGLMMAIGIGVAYLVVFTFFPAALMLTQRTRPPHSKARGISLTTLLARFTVNRGGIILVVGLLLVVLGALGISRLSVENRFIDYFKQDTEIYQGMELIDAHLGGTTPLEVILDGDGKNYWYKPENRQKLRKIHDFLDSLPETGKVLSLDTTIRIAEKINPFLVGLLQFLPADLKTQVLDPYVNSDGSQAHISVRILETNRDLRRAILVNKIETFLEKEMQIPAENYRLTGIYVLYNNLLQSLFNSQIMTIGVVFFATWLMFSLLFRSFYLALIAIIPNIFPVAVVLGTLGLAGIPLDIMTVTVAAITIGIAVDHTIHYIHRFKLEFAELGDYAETVYRCHGSIGNAMYYTSITIIAGFSILALSNFIPTIYFGLFTSLAMIVALLAAMTLLPRLLIVLKPLGPESQSNKG